MIRRLTATVLVLLLCLGAAGATQAASVRVTATVERPAWFLTACTAATWETCLRDRWMQPSSTRTWVPAAFQRVFVYQPRQPTGKIFCGETYTDASGRISKSFRCGDGATPDQLFLEVWGTSAKGFTVGAFDRTAFELEIGATALAALAATVISYGTASAAALATAAGLGTDALLKLLNRPPNPYTWTTDMETVSGTTHDFGTVTLGGLRGAQAANDDYAAAVMEGVHHAYLELELPIDPNDPGSGASWPAWGWSYWIINNPYFGGPTTIWNIVHMNQAVSWLKSNTFNDNMEASWQQNVRSIAHELGHVVYNAAHSDPLHYWGEVVGYAKQHTPCEDRYNTGFAQYEGYAEAISDIVWRNHALTVGRTNSYRLPSKDCKTPSLLDEGNVTDFYTAIYHGVDYNRPASSYHQRHIGTFGADRAALPPLETMLTMAKDAGSGSHSLADMWSNTWSKTCSQVEDGVTLFCGTERFKCWVRDKLATTAELPAALDGLDCLPTAPAKVEVATSTVGETSSQSVISWPAGDHVDEYLVHVSPAPTTPAATPHSLTTTSLTVAAPPCVAYTVRVDASNAQGVDSGPTVTFVPGEKSAWCRPGPATITSVKFSHAVTGLDETLRAALGFNVPSTGGSIPIDDPRRDGVVEPDSDLPGGHDAPPDAEPAADRPTTATLEHADEVCYQVTHSGSKRADAYQVRYSAPGHSSLNAGWSPDLELNVCLDVGVTWTLSAVARNDFGETVGPPRTQVATDPTAVVKPITKRP